MITMDNIPGTDPAPQGPLRNLIYLAGICLVIWMIVLYALVGGFSS